MRKETKPTYHATDGTIFTDPFAAATHDARLIFENMFDDPCVSPSHLATKWVEIRDKLSTLHNDYIGATIPIPYVVGIPADVFWDKDKYSFVTKLGTILGEPFKRHWILRKEEFPLFPQAEEDEAGATADLAPVSPAADPEWRNKSRDHPARADFLQIPGETDPRG